MFPPFASSEGYSASGVRYQSDGVRDTHPLPHFWIHSHSREDVWSYAHTFSFSFCLLFLYLIIFTLNYSFYSVIITLWSSYTYFTAVSDGCWRINTSIGFPRHCLSCVNGRWFNPGNPPRWFGTFAYITHQVSVLCYPLSHILLVI